MSETASRIAPWMRRSISRPDGGKAKSEQTTILIADPEHCPEVPAAEGERRACSAPKAQPSDAASEKAQSRATVRIRHTDDGERMESYASYFSKVSLRDPMEGSLGAPTNTRNATGHLLRR